jgi:hypothetical protein
MESGIKQNGEDYKKKKSIILNLILKIAIVLIMNVINN